MRELDNGVADAMRTSSHKELENGKIPQIHETPQVTAMRRKGIETEISRANDERRAYNAQIDHQNALERPTEPQKAQESDLLAKAQASLQNRLQERLEQREQARQAEQQAERERQMGAKEYQVWLAEHLTQRKEKPSSGLIIRHLLGFDENNQPILETFRSSETTEQAPAEQTEKVTEPASEFGHSNPNHLEEPPRRESCEDTPKVKQINLDLYKLLVPAAAIAGVAILALGYRKQDKLIGGLKAIKNQLKSLKKD